MKTLVALLISMLTLCSLTPYARQAPLAIELSSHFAPQYLLAAVVLALAVFYFKLNLLWLLPLGAAFALSLWLVGPYFKRNVPPAPDGVVTLKVLQINVLYTHRDTEPLRRLIAREKPDVIVAAETNSAFAALFADLLPEYPHQDVDARDHDARGMALLSRHAPVSLERKAFGKARVPAHVFTLAMPQEQNDSTAEHITFISIHPFTPVHDLRARDAELDGLAGSYAATDTGHLVVLGDFNATPWCPALRHFTQNLRLRHARLGRGIMGSWPAWLPAPLRLPIDHLLAGGHIGVARYTPAENIGSDHLPFVAEIYISKPL